MKDAIDLSPYQADFFKGVIGRDISACKVRKARVGDTLSVSLMNNSTVEIRIRELTNDKAIGCLLSDCDANDLELDSDLQQCAEVVVDINKGYWTVEN